MTWHVLTRCSAMELRPARFFLMSIWTPSCALTDLPVWERMERHVSSVIYKLLNTKQLQTAVEFMAVRPGGADLDQRTRLTHRDLMTSEWAKHEDLFFLSALGPTVQAQGRKYTTVIKDADLIFFCWECRPTFSMMGTVQWSLSAGSRKPAGHVGLSPRNKLIRCGGLNFNSI